MISGNSGIISPMIDLVWDSCGIYRVKMQPFKAAGSVITYGTRDLSAATDEAETNREAFKRLKGKPPRVASERADESSCSDVPANVWTSYGRSFVYETIALTMEPLSLFNKWG